MLIRLHELKAKQLKLKMKPEKTEEESKELVSLLDLQPDDRILALKADLERLKAQLSGDEGSRGTKRKSTLPLL